MLREGEYGERAGIPWVVYADGAPLAIADPYHHPHFVPTLDHNSHFKSASLLALPLRGADGETLGVLELLNKWPDAAAAAPAADERRPSVDVALHAAQPSGPSSQRLSQRVRRASAAIRSAVRRGAGESVQCCC